VISEWAPWRHSFSVSVFFFLFFQAASNRRRRATVISRLGSLCGGRRVFLKRSVLLMHQVRSFSREKPVPRREVRIRFQFVESFEGTILTKGS